MKVNKGAVLGFVSGVLGILGMVVSHMISANDKQTLKEEIKKDILEDLSSENNQGG